MSDLEMLDKKLIVGADGKPTAVIIDIQEFEKLMEYIEDLEDLRFVEEADQEGFSLRPYQDFRKELKEAGKL